MIESHGQDRSLVAIGTAEHETRKLGHGANAEKLRRCRGGGEQPVGVICRNDQAKLEIFTVVERVIDFGCAITLTHFMSVRMDGNCRLFKYGSDAATLVENVAQVGR